MFDESKSIDKISDFLTPIAEKMQELHLITALTETMQANMPVTIIGSFACLIAFLDLGSWQEFLAAHPSISTVCMNIQSLTLSIFGFYVLLLLPYLYAKKLNMKQASAMIPMTVAAYLLLTPHDRYKAIYSEWLGHKGLISVIIVTFVVVRVTKFFLDKKICIRMPAGVPKFVEDGFAILVPAAVIFAGFAVIEFFFEKTELVTFHNVVYIILQQPFKKIGLSLFGVTFTEFATSLAMFLGLHSMTVVGVVKPLRLAASMENIAAWQANMPLPNIVCDGFYTLSLIGAGGNCLVITLAFLFFAKSKRYKSISRMALVPGIFGVGEPILFGLPVMLNPTVFIPFILVTVFNQIYSYLVVWSGLVGRFTGVQTAFTVPPFINLALSNSTPGRAIIACVIELIIDLAIWYPFVKIADKMALKEEAVETEAVEA